MVIILDADVIIRGEKGSFDLHSWLCANANEQFEIAAITVAELWHSVERATGRHKLARLNYLQTMLAPLPVIPYTQQTALEHARIRAKLEAAGKMPNAYDLIVAATAMERASALATFNKRHFEPIEGLSLIEPGQVN